MNKKIHFIINPASGQPFPILHTLNSVCDKHNCDWTYAVTRKNNVSQLACEASKSDADVIAVYGGDGTVAEVSSALINSNKILGILPGGTANILSVELGLPQNITKACVLLCKGNYQYKEIDVGKVNDKYFLLRVGFGLEAEAVKGANRTFKNNVGILAYALSGFKALVKTKPAKYELVLDGKKHSCEGLSLVVANSGNLGLPGMTLMPKINISDGYLDLIVIRTADLQKLFKLDEQDAPMSELLALFKHWQVKEVSVKTTSNQAIHYDGEVLESGELNIEVLPRSLKIVC